MTAREIFDHHLFRLRLLWGMALLVFFGMIVFLIALGPARLRDPVMFTTIFSLAIVCMGFILAASWYGKKWIRCPTCQGDLILLAMPLLRLDHVRFCPHCEAVFDRGSAKVPKAKSLEDDFA